MTGVQTCALPISGFTWSKFNTHNCAYLVSFKRASTVRLKFRGPQNQVLGVPQGQAAFVGVLIGLAVLVALALLASEPWVIATNAMAYGFIAQIPGAYTIKLLRRVREAVGG